MRRQQLNNSARALILVFAIVILTIVSAKADMVKATYSPYKCAVDTNNKNKDNAKSNLSLNISFINLNEYITMRKFQLQKHPEYKMIKEEVRRQDVTSSKSKQVMVVKIDDCEYPVYKII